MSLFLLIVISTFPLAAQQSLYFQERNPHFRDAMDLFQKEKYNAAQHTFEKCINAISDQHSEVRVEAEYYNAICAIELFHGNAAALLLQFISEHPESPHRTAAYFNLAKYQFRKRKYQDAVQYLSTIDPLDLSKEDASEYYFKKGYSYFELDEFEKAASAFYEIKDTDNNYSSAARYYYAHIAYIDKNYQTAATDFHKIEHDAQFGLLVPYYLTQIYYLQGKYEQLLAYAPGVLDSTPPKNREEEIRRLIGNSFYETGQYEKAIPYLSDYLKHHSGTADDYYQLGYSLFSLKQYSDAIDAFKKAIQDDDALSQSAYYYIGESSMKLDKKVDARSAFRSAYKLGIDDFLTEDALFNYAKIAYELSYHPYNDAIKAFEEYIDRYPDSKRIDDAYEYLVGVYFTTKNYEEALKSIDRIKGQNIKLQQAKQKLAYYRGIELYDQKSFNKAAEMFQLSLKTNYDAKLKASAQYWLGESYYQLNEYKNAGNSFHAFLASSGARSLDYFPKGYYNLGYVYYEQKNYERAAFWFREYVDKAQKKNKALINDAYLRLGDSYFIQKQYHQAITYYNNATIIGVKNKSYSTLQAAIANGVLGNYQEKVTLLKNLLKEDKTSVYRDDALFELGKTYLLLNQENDALANYNRLIDNFPNSNYLSDAYLKVGLIHYNKHEDDLAISAFDKVVEKFPKQAESTEALERIRLIFIDKGDLAAFEDYIKGVPFADVSQSKLDSTSYTIAENNYLQGDCEKANRDFTNYLNRYPDGIFSLNAHFYRGNCEMKSDFEQEASKDFEVVIQRAPNKFLEKALVAVGQLYRSLHKMDSAISTYQQLIKVAERQDNILMAKKALMEIYFEQEDYENASIYADEILKSKMFSTEIWQQAQMIMAKSYLMKEKVDLATPYLDKLSKTNSKLGAEAKYLLAQNYYLEGNLEKSDTLIYKLINQVPSYSYWIAKGFILLADNFVAKDDIYNAKLTFQSVIDNADNAELIEIANGKLRILKDSEKKPIDTTAAPEIQLKSPIENQKKEKIKQDQDSVQIIKKEKPNEK